jgi:hypothetical protein
MKVCAQDAKTPGTHRSIHRCAPADLGNRDAGRDPRYREL